MPYEFLAKNGLISQGNITATGSLTVTQNITASNISASGTIIATSFTGSFSGSIGTAINATSASYALSASYAPTNTNITASWATNSLTASYLTPANIYTVAGLSSGYVEVTGTSTIPNTGIYRPAGKTLGLSADGTLILKIDGNASPYVTSIETGNFIVLSGSVGIGVVSPVNKLDINGNISASVITASFFGTSSWATNAVTASFVSNAFVQGGNSFGTTALLGTNDANSLAFETNGSTRMTINSAGFIGVNASPTLDKRFNIANAHNGSLGSSSLYIATGQNQNQGLATSANDSGITNVYTVNNFTSSAAIQNQAIYNQTVIAGSGSFSGSYRASRNAINFSNTASLDINGSIINTYLTNQISPNIPTFSINNWIAGTQTYVDIVTGNSTGSITNLYQHQISSPFPSGGSGGITVNNSYGIYIAKQKTTNIVTNGWGIYQVDTGDLNIFAGKTRIGSTTVPVNTLDVTGNISASVVTASLFFGTASFATTASSLVAANSYTVTNLTASNVLRAAKIAEKVVTFTPLTGSLTGAPAWYRIISGSGVADYGRVRLSTTFDNSRSDLEFTYGVRNYDIDGAGAFINITRASTYNSVFNAVRVIEGTLTTPYAIDVLIGNYLNNTTPDTVTCLYESQFQVAILDTPTFVSASETGSNSNVVKTVYPSYTSGYRTVGPVYSDGLSVATYQGQLTVGYRGNYNYGSPSTNNYALLVSGSVGIGTTSPGEKLTVSGSSYIIGGTGAVGTGTAYYLGDSSNKDISLTRVGAATLAIGRYFPSAWVETIRFTADGNVGIGTTSPRSGLQVNTVNGAAANEYAGLIVSSNLSSSRGVNIAYDATNDAGIITAVHAGTGWKPLALQPVNGNVGIGTTNPTARLHVSSSTGGVFEVDTAGGTTTFYVSASGNVGIGTITPNGKLHIVSPDSTYAFSVAGATKGVRFNINSAGTYIQGVDNTLAGSYQSLILGGSDLYFQTNGLTTAMYISSSGNVGIGTSSPTEKLSVVSGSTRIASSALAGALYLGNDGNNIYLERDNSYDLTLVQNGASNNSLYLVSAGNVYINIDSNNNDTDKAFIVQNNALKAGTELFRIQENGNIGIGTTVPLAITDIQGTNVTLYAANYVGSVGTIYLRGNDAYNSGTAGAGIYLRGKYDSSSNVTTFGAISAIKENNIDGNYAGALTFLSRTNGQGSGAAEKMRIDSNGNVGIGTSSPVAKLEITGSSTNVLFNINSPISGNIIFVTGSGCVGINKSTPTATFDVSGSTIITGSLNVSNNITCLSLTETSTEAVKYNILPLPSQLENVLKLKPVSFNYKTNDKHSIGLIAEEVAKIYPEFTSENNDSISYGKITSVLIQSIKELKNIIDNQQKQIEDLSNKLK